MTEKQRDEAHKYAIVWDKTNPLSVYSLVPDPLKIQLDKLAQSDIAYLLTFDERQLRKELNQRRKEPGYLEESIRMKFWIEYDRVHLTRGDRMWITNIASRLLDMEHFYTNFIRDPYKLIWVMCPPENFIVTAEAVLKKGMASIDALWEIPPERWDHRVRLCFIGRMRLARELRELITGAKPQGIRENPEPGDPRVPAAPMDGHITDLMTKVEEPRELTEAEIDAEYEALMEKTKNLPGAN